MSVVQQLYGLSTDDALRLSDSQVQFMLETAEMHTRQLLVGNASFQAAIGQRLAGVKRSVRQQLDTGSDGGDTGGSGVGQPPTF